MYLNENGAVLSVDGGYFCVKQKNGLLRKIPKETLESITIFGKASMTTPCIQECLRRGIPVNYFSGKGRYYGKLSSTRHVNAARLRQQVLACEDTDFCNALARNVVSAKIGNQCVLLRRYQRNQEKIVGDEIERMQQLRKNLSRNCDTNEIMGTEGLAARLYFSALSRLVRPEFHFQGRSRQPPKDPFNSMLSLGYTILMYEIYAEIESRGLSPYIGFLHKDHTGHPTLASDLMEEWRAVVVDSTVMSLVQGKEIFVEQFHSDEETGGILLTPDAMKIFIRKLEQKLEGSVRYLNDTPATLRRCFYLQSVSLTRAIESKDVDLYQPVLIR